MAVSAENVQKAYLAYFGRPADPVGLAYWQNSDAATMKAGFAASAEYAALYSGMTVEARVSQVYTNLLGRSPDAPGLLYWAGELAAGRQTISSLVDAMQTNALGVDITTIANRVTYATAFTAAVDTASEIVGYSGTAAANAARTAVASVVDTAASLTTATTAIATSVSTVVASGTSSVGATFTLTEAINTVTGDSSNNTIDGSLATTVAGRLQTWNNADSIDGGAGTDTLTVQITAAVTAASFKNIEVLSIENQTNNIAVDLNSGDNTLTTIKNVNSGANDLTVQNVQSAVANYEVSNNSAGAAALTVTVANTLLAGTADAATLTVNNVTDATISLGTVSAASGYETISVVSSGSVKNGGTTDLVLDDGAGTSLATVNVSGSTALDLDITPTTVTTVNASTMTGALDVQLVNGNVRNVSVTGGTGNDIISVGQTAGDYTTADTISGGSGTDRLVLINADATNATATQSNVSGIEVIGLADGISGTVSLTNFGATGLRFGANTAAAGNISYTAGTGTLDLQTFTLGHAVVATAAGFATTDVLGLTIGSTAAGNNSGSTMTLTGFETVNVLSQGGANTITALTLTNTASTEAIVVTGDQTLTLATSIVADSISASGMTGSAALIMGANANTLSMTITGTANADTLRGGTAADIINGGSGADAIFNVAAGNTASAGDVLTGGAGFDTFTLRGDVASGVLSTIQSTAARITDFTVGSTATTTDILQLSATTTDYSAAGTQVPTGLAAAAAGATGIQTVAQNAAATAYVAGTDLIKLTTGVATTGLTFQQAFNAAIGSATVTGSTANVDEIFFTIYDTTNSRMDIGIVNAGAGNAVYATADVVTLVGTVDMTAADYALFSAANLSIV